MVLVDRNEANRPHASLAGSGIEIIYDDDAQHELHNVLLLL
jgi:hypothetical protein